MLLSPNKKCRIAQSASCPQSLPCHFLVCSERCKAERIPVREVTGSATGCGGEEFPHLLLHVCWTLFGEEGHVWAIGSFTLQVFLRQTLVQSSWWGGGGESNIMEPIWPYVWSLAQVNKLVEAGEVSEWSCMKRFYGSSWKLGGLEFLLCCVTLEEFISLSCLRCCWSALFLWGMTDSLCWLCDSFVWDIHFLRYISGRFGTQDVAQRWKHKYQDVCNALDMVGFQEQVSSGVV